MFTWSPWDISESTLPVKGDVFHGFGDIHVSSVAAASPNQKADRFSQSVFATLTPMNLPSVTLRPVNPLYEEGVVFARYLNAIAPFYRVMLGRGA